MNDSKTIEKTKRRLRRAYAKLLETEDSKKITVSKLADEADISRATFYLHYESFEAFREDAGAYVLGLFEKQMVKFTAESYEGIAENCKKNNLLMNDYDIELFRNIIKKDMTTEEMNCFMARIYNAVYNFALERDGREFIEKNKTYVKFFLRGYIFCIAESLIDYDYNKLRGNLTRCYDLWYFLIERKEKNELINKTEIY